MKVIFNTDQVYLHGGIEKVMAIKANYLANLSDVEVYIVTTEQDGNRPCYPLDKKIKLIDLGVNYNRTQSYFSWENIRKAFKHLECQWKLFRKLKPDVIISPNFNFDHYWLPFIHQKAKKIKEIHNSRYNWQQSIKNRLNEWFERRYDTIVVLNKDEAKYFVSDNVVIIPNPIIKKEKQCHLMNKQVIAAGRLTPVKGFHELILAWKEVYMNFPDWRLHIYGQDYNGTINKLQEEIDENGLQEVIAFMGNVEDLPQTMLDYSIYVMSSVTECFPMVLLEALSVGLPVVSYDCPNGPRNIITDRIDGVLIKERKPTALAAGLMQLMTNSELRFSMGLKAKVNSIRFETESIMKIWVSLLTKNK